MALAVPPGHKGESPMVDPRAARNWRAAARTFGPTASLVPYQATFALLTISRNRSSAACLFRQMM